MNLQKLRTPRQPRLMIIPMIDIIFFLLVFFMMSTLYMSEQKALPVQLPQAASGEAVPERTVAVTVLADGRILFEQEEVARVTLRQRIETAQRMVGDVPLFVLRSDERTEYGNVVFVLDELKAAGVKRIAFATARKAE